MMTRLILALVLISSSVMRAEDNPFVGRWGLTLPDGRAGWLGVEQKDSGLSASLLWRSGSVLPADKVAVAHGVLTVEQTTPTKRGSTMRQITAIREGDNLKLTATEVSEDGKAGEPETFSGKLSAPLPPRPDLSKVAFGPPIQLFAGDFNATWRLIHDDDESGWSLKDGVLANQVRKVKGKRLGNLRTRQEFGDFRITTELRTQAGSNSGIYLRGIYEIQVADTYGKPLDPHNMGALYSRITPTVLAEKPVGEWQTLDITLVDRHVTVILNGVNVIDNQPVLGCTGGALWSDESKPGPIMLQGDHSSIEFRNMEIYPIKK